MTTTHPRPTLRIALPVATAALVTLGLAGCGSGTTSTGNSPTASASGPSSPSSTPTAGGEAIDVSVLSSETACNVIPVRVPAGNVAFATSNTGDSVTGFALYEGKSDQTPVAESRNIKPGENGEFRVTLKPGEYTAVCRPGETGAGIRVTFTVTKS